MSVAVTVSLISLKPVFQYLRAHRSSGRNPNLCCCPERWPWVLAIEASTAPVAARLAGQPSIGRTWYSCTTSNVSRYFRKPNKLGMNTASLRGQPLGNEQYARPHVEKPSERAPNRVEWIGVSTTESSDAYACFPVGPEEARLALQVHRWSLAETVEAVSSVALEDRSATPPALGTRHGRTEPVLSGDLNAGTDVDHSFAQPPKVRQKLPTRCLGGLHHHRCCSSSRSQPLASRGRHRAWGQSCSSWCARPASRTAC